MRKRPVIGIDEVGRGALAGPVVVAAALVSCPISVITREAKRHGLPSLKDSKQLSALQREIWFSYCMQNSDISFCVARVNPRGIERMNISRSANLAAKRAFENLIEKIGTSSNVKIVLDGGLFIGDKVLSASYGAQTFPKADETVPAVAIASIIAKVTRDRCMVRLGKRYPLYGFGVHKGYGTAAHRKALEKHGPAEVHRLTFLRQKTII